MASFSERPWPANLRVRERGGATILSWRSWRRDYLPLAIFMLAWDALIVLFVSVSKPEQIFCMTLHILTGILGTFAATRVLPRRTTVTIARPMVEISTSIIPGLNWRHRLDLREVTWLKTRQKDGGIRPAPGMPAAIPVFGLLGYREGADTIEILPLIVGADVALEVGDALGQALGIGHQFLGADEHQFSGR